MAKIYETREDYKRDKLAQQANELRLQAGKESNSGLALLGVSLVMDVINATAKKARSWLFVASNVIGVIGIVESIKSWFTSSKAADLDRKRESLGPQQVVVMNKHEGHAQEECPTCPTKDYAGHRLVPRTLAEYARTSGESDLSK